MGNPTESLLPFAIFALLSTLPEGDCSGFSPPAAVAEAAGDDERPLLERKGAAYVGDTLFAAYVEADSPGVRLTLLSVRPDGNASTRTLARADAGGPPLLFGAGGSLYVVWVHWDGDSFRLSCFQREKGGFRQTVVCAGGSLSLVDGALFGEEVYLLWRAEGSDGLFSARSPGFDVKSGPGFLEKGALFGSTAGDPSGRLHIIWLGGPGPQVYYAGSMDGGETWSEPRTPFADSLNHRPSLSCDPQGRLHLLWTAHGSTISKPGALMYERSLDGGQTWEGLVTMKSPGRWIGDPVVAPDGAGNPLVFLSDVSSLIAEWGTDFSNVNRLACVKKSLDGSPEWVCYVSDSTTGFGWRFAAASSVSGRVGVVWVGRNAGGKVTLWYRTYGPD